ncbi:MAG: hypothetical protein U0457_16610 [Candidatus Sericytochromatia bacterium]
MKKSKKLSLLIGTTVLFSCNSVVLENSKKIDDTKKEVTVSKMQEPVIVKSIIPTPTLTSAPSKEPENTNGILKTQENTSSAENNKVIFTPIPSSTPSNVGNGVNNISSFEPINTSTNKQSSCIDEKPVPVTFNKTTEPIVGCAAISGEPNSAGCFSMPESSFYYGKKLYFVYNRILPTPDGLQTGDVELIFKDEYKIRYNLPKNEFYSLICSVNTSELNKIIKNYSNINIIDSHLNLSEEKAREDELSLEKEQQNDYSNSKSIYTLVIKDVNAKELVESLRKLEYVRESNLSPVIGIAH